MTATQEMLVIAIQPLEPARPSHAAATLVPGLGRYPRSVFDLMPKASAAPAVTLAPTVRRAPEKDLLQRLREAALI